MDRYSTRRLEASNRYRRDAQSGVAGGAFCGAADGRAPPCILLAERGTPAGNSHVKIIKAEVIVTSPDRNFVTLKITTDDGVIGLGDATLNGRELAVVSYLRDHVVPLLIGRDAAPHRGHLAVPLPRRVLAARPGHHGRDRRGRHGAVGHQGQGGGHAALPAARRREPHRTASRTGTRQRQGPAGALRLIREHLEQGYRAIRVQTGVPGLEAIYGVASNAVAAGNEGKRYDYEPAAARRAARPRRTGTPAPTCATCPTVFEAVRNEFGPELPLLHDGHHRMTPIQAAKLGKSLEPYDLFWLEDCTPGREPGGAAARAPAHHDAARDRRGVQHGLGLPDAHPASSSSTTCAARSRTRAASSPMKKILDYAAQYQIKSGMHGPTDISPVGMAAALHLGLAIHNFGIQEYMQHGEATNEVFQQSFTFADGLLHPGEKPGLGVELDVDEAGKYPYQPAYLPFNRLADGTVHDW